MYGIVVLYITCNHCFTSILGIAYTGKGIGSTVASVGLVPAGIGIDDAVIELIIEVKIFSFLVDI